METLSKVKSTASSMKRGAKVLQLLKKVDWGVFLKKNNHIVLLSLITVAGLYIRLARSINNYGQIHPDELYQSLEIAHDMIFGYGIIPPEFRTTTDPPSYGMSRSPIFPYLFAFFFWIGKTFNLDYWGFSFLAIRVFLALNATVLIPTSYYFLKQLVPSSDRTTPLFGSFVIAFWWEFTYYGIRSLTNTFFTPWIFLFLGYFLKEFRRISQDQEFDPSRIFLASFFLGLFSYIRVDQLVVIGPVLLPGMILVLISDLPWKSKGRFYLEGFTGLVFSILFAGFVDKIYYGVFLVSPLHWFRFNIVEKRSEIFGVSPFFAYFSHFFVQRKIPLTLMLFAIIFLVLATANGLHLLQRSSPDSSLQKSFYTLTYGNLIFLAALSVSTLLIFSIPKHKEPRFVFSSIVLIYLIAAISYSKGLQALLIIANQVAFPETALSFEKRKIGAMMLLAILIISGSSSDSQTVDWQPFGDHNLALKFISEQSDVTGVLGITHWFFTGGYTYLHKNVPLLFKYYVDDPGEFAAIRALLLRSNIYNYVIVPWWQYPRNEELNSTLLFAGYVKIYNARGVDVWKHSSLVT